MRSRACSPAAGVEGGIAGGAELGRLLESPREEDLIVAAQAMRHLGKGAYRPLEKLLARAEPAVRRAALKAAEGVADVRLVPTLLALLEEPSSRGRAGQALVAIGEGAAPSLAALLDDPRVPRPVRLEVPRLLRRIPRPASYALLRSHLRTSDSRLRVRLHAALSHLRRELALAPEPVGVIHELVSSEIEEAEFIRAGWTAARPRFGAVLLDELFQLRLAWVTRRVLRILELRYDPEALALIREHIVDPARRANALETLDALLDPPLRTLVMPFCDDFRAPYVAAPPEPVAFLVNHTRHPNPYIALLALDAFASRTDPAGVDAAQLLLTHPDALVREGAILAVAAGRRPDARDRLAPLASDPDRHVARLARRALDRLDGHPTEDRMYSTLEKILFLKSAAIFERVTGEDLAPAARIAEVELYAPGEPIVREGERGDALFILVRGTATVERGGRVIATLGPGDAVGEMAVLDSEPRSATVRATSEVEALRMGSEAFYEILHEQVEIAEGVIRVLSQRVRSLDERLAS